MLLLIVLISGSSKYGSSDDTIYYAIPTAGGWTMTVPYNLGLLGPAVEG